MPERSPVRSATCTGRASLSARRLREAGLDPADPLLRQHRGARQ